MLNPTIAQFAQSYEKRTAAAQVAPAQGVPPATTGTPQNGAVRTLNGLTLPEVPHIRWEKRSLLSLFVTGKLPPIDVAALAYLSSTAMKNSGLSRDEVVYEHFENLPLLSTIMETAWGRVGLITIPRLGTELYQDEEVMDLILEGLQMAGRFGAKVVSLTGLIPSATDYGNAILAASTGYGELPQVTTGHATTSAAVLLSMQRLLQEAKRDLQHETVGFIGLGSVGMATLHTMLQAMPHPKALILCDLFSKAETLAQTRRDLIDQYGYTGEIQVATAHAAAPDAIYAATLIVGATNVPDVLEIGRVQPGTLLVDDSAPHCFDVQQAIQRLETQEDILFTEGGVLELPQPIQYHVHATRPLEPMLKDTRLFKETEATGCVFSSLLAARYPELTPTIGLVDPHAGAAHYAKLQELGIRAAALHCRDYHLPKRLIRSFRYRFGGK
jgi:predicted amino acid dehydrogenase